MGQIQELLLLAVVNTRFVSQGMITVFQGCGFANFAIFDPVFSLLPAEYRGQFGYNALSDRSQYHPYIFFPHSLNIIALL